MLKKSKIKIASNCIDFVFFSDKNLRYHNSNKENILKGILAEENNVKINNELFSMKGGCEVRFYESGEIFSFTLAEDKEIKILKNKIKFQKGTEISFYINGSIHSGSIADEYILNIAGRSIKFKKSFNEKSRIFFYNNGCVESGFLAQSTSFIVGVNTIELIDKISFYDNGKIKLGTLKDAAVFKTGYNVIKLKKKTNETVEFYENGTLRQAFLESAYDIKVENIKFKFCNKLVFDSRGNPVQGTLADDLVYNGAIINKDKKISIIYDENGSLAQIRISTNSAE